MKSLFWLERHIYSRLKHTDEYNYQDTKGRTVLHDAASIGDTQSVREILEKGVNNEELITLVDNEGCTALDLACLKRHDDLAEIICEYQNNVFSAACLGLRYKKVTKMINRGQKVDALIRIKIRHDKQHCRWTALHWPSCLICSD